MSSNIERIESRQSQLLRITHWLNTSSEDECLKFLEDAKHELHHESIGSLIASLLLRSKNYLSNNNLNSLVNLCKSNNNQRSSVSNIHVFNIKNKCFPLLSLSDNTLDHLGWYLGKQDSISMGICCHTLYRITQRESFLKKCGLNYKLVMTSSKMKKIYDFGIDPWSMVYGCGHLSLADGNTNTMASIYNTDSMIGEMILEIKKRCYYTNWFQSMFRNAQSLTICGSGGGLISCIPMDALFGIEKYSKHINRVIKIDRIPLQLTIAPCGENGYDTPILGAGNQFGERYKDYFESKCQCKLENIRGIKSIKRKWGLSHSFASSLSNQIKLSYFHPNYKIFKWNDQVLDINSLAEFNDIFHENLETIIIGKIQFASLKIACDVYRYARKCGFVFSLADMITNITNILER